MNKKIKSRFAEGVLSIPTQAYQLWVGNFARSVEIDVKKPLISKKANSGFEIF